MAIKATVFPLSVCLFTCCDTEFTQPTLNKEKIKGELWIGDLVLGGTQRYQDCIKSYQGGSKRDRGGPERYQEVPRGTERSDRDINCHIASRWFLLVLGGSLWIFLVLGGSLWSFVVLGGSCWLLVVHGDFL